MTNQAKEYWQIDTESMANSIKKAAKSAQTEEDLKMALEPIFQKAYQQIGVDVDIVKYEKSTALKAKIDAVYGYLIIEYKRPGKKATIVQRKRAEELAEQGIPCFCVDSLKDAKKYIDKMDSKFVENYARDLWWPAQEALKTFD